MITITPDLENKNIKTYNKLAQYYSNKPVTKPFASQNPTSFGNISSEKATATIPVDSFDDPMQRIINSADGLSKSEEINIKSELAIVDAQIKILEERRLKLGRLLDYDTLRKNGFSTSEVRQFIKEDDQALKDADRFVTQTNRVREYMFGYPANMTEDSAMTKYLRRKESELALMNNCGDPYDAGNYLLDSKSYERALLEKLFDHFGLDKTSNPWGYITTGGSESNKWGIHNGLRKFPEGRVYYSTAAHYSVGKSVKIGFDQSKNDITLIKHSEIPPQKGSEKIDTEILLSQIRENWKQNHEPAIVLLTAGTTKTGAVDDIEFISKRLDVEKIPHYIHVDAALFGGIAKNQKNAPRQLDMSKLGIDSISVSLHKYFGNHDVKSVVITKEPPNAPKVDYIGQYDSTTAGSRTFNPFSSLQRINETLDRKMPNDYSKNVKIFERLLNEYKIDFSRAEHSNIFVIDQPSEYVYSKYQLSNFEDEGEQKSHIIIFPSHKESKMVELVYDLAEDRKKIN